MELLPIIKASLGIFTLLTSIAFIVSFVVYKIKNRNSLKPYQRKPIIFDSSPILEVHDTIEETINQNQFSDKFEVLNINSISNKTNRKIGKTLDPTNAYNSNQFQISKPHRRSPNEVFNIYSFYSNNDSRPMHKLKVRTLTAE